MFWSVGVSFVVVGCGCLVVAVTVVFCCSGIGLVSVVDC